MIRERNYGDFFLYFILVVVHCGFLLGGAPLNLYSVFICFWTYYDMFINIWITYAPKWTHRRSLNILQVWPAKFRTPNLIMVLVDFSSPYSYFIFYKNGTLYSGKLKYKDLLWCLTSCFILWIISLKPFKVSLNLTSYSADGVCYLPLIRNFTAVANIRQSLL